MSLHEGIEDTLETHNDVVIPDLLSAFCLISAYDTHEQIPACRPSNQPASQPARCIGRKHCPRHVRACHDGRRRFRLPGEPAWLPVYTVLDGGQILMAQGTCGSAGTKAFCLCGPSRWSSSFHLNINWAV